MSAISTIAHTRNPLNSTEQAAGPMGHASRFSKGMPAVFKGRGLQQRARRYVELQLACQRVTGTGTPTFVQFDALSSRQYPGTPLQSLSTIRQAAVPFRMPQLSLPAMLSKFRSIPSFPISSSGAIGHPLTSAVWRTQGLQKGCLCCHTLCLWASEP